MPSRDKDAVQAAGKVLLDRIDAVMADADWSGFVALADMLPQVERTFLTGAGRSGLVARSFGMRLMHAGLPAFIPGETVTPPAGAGDLLVGVSCTGTTGYTEYIAGRARELGAQVIVITAEPQSPLAQGAHKVILVPAKGDDIVVRAAVFEHAASLCLDAVFNILVDRLKLDPDSLRQRHANLESGLRAKAIEGGRLRSIDTEEPATDCYRRKLACMGWTQVYNCSGGWVSKTATG